MLHEPELRPLSHDKLALDCFAAATESNMKVNCNCRANGDKFSIFTATCSCQAASSNQVSALSSIQEISLNDESG